MLGTAGAPVYTGRENVPVTTEATQAAIYGALVREAACDEDVAAVNFFGFHDDSLRTGFQSGLYRADGTARPAHPAPLELQLRQPVHLGTGSRLDSLRSRVANWRGGRRSGRRKG